MRPDPLGGHSETVRLVLDGDDPYYQVPNPYHPRFYLIPRSVEAEFDLDERDPLKALRRVRISGQRYRHMASGEIKAVGPGRGPADETTVWEFRRSMGGDMDKMVRAAAQHRLPPRPWEGLSDSGVLFAAERLMQKYPDADASDPMMASVKVRLHRIAGIALIKETT